MTTTPTTPTPEELLTDPSTPTWAVDAIRFWLRRDPVDVANALSVLAESFRARAERMVDNGGLLTKEG